MRIIFTGCLVFLLYFLPNRLVLAQPTQLPATVSVLNTGNWFKIGITSSGIYKIDADFLKAAGLPVTALDPRQLKIYGNGGGMLPQPNRSPRPDDLIQNAIYVAGEADGKFDPADYLLFYGQGPHTWAYDLKTEQFRHQFNLYTDTAYYFLTVNSAPGLRVQTQLKINGATQIITTYTERQFHEQDLNKPLPSGREWYGENFSVLTPSRSFSFPATNLVPGSKITVGAALMSSSATNSQFALQANGKALGTQLINGQGTHDYHAVGEENLNFFTFTNETNPGNNLELRLTFNYLDNIHATGYLNYLEITSERYLRLTGKQMVFRSRQNIAPQAVSAFKIENAAAGTQVWEITQPFRPRVMPLETTATTGQFGVKTDSLREFICFTGSDFPKPKFVHKIKNQNLHALNVGGDLDFVIITHPWFKAAADKLAEHRRSRDNLKVAVVTINEVYNEFSSGSADVTAIRDLMKLVYNRSTKARDGRVYLLLFGDASFDYKSGVGSAKTRTPFNTNFVPVYESRESLDPLLSFSSEDYFGLLDPQEGLWSEVDFNTSEQLDIGIGRLPAKTPAEAQTLVNKIIHYESPASHGNWRNQVTFLADDGDNAEHLHDAENLAGYLAEKQPAYNGQKLYLDLHKQIPLANGQRSPEFNAALHQAIEKGTLLLNYTGHGNEITLAHEQVLTIPEINSWENYDRLTFMLTATCEFGRYDDPKRNSGAEAALLHGQGGAIGLLTTTRPVYASHNRVLNRQFFEHAFTPANGQMPRLGEIYRNTKNKSRALANNRNFTLLGDPTLRLAYPQLQATITHLNHIPVKTATPDTLQALVKNTLTGHITDERQNLISTFTGEVNIVVLNKATLKQTLGDESTSPTRQQVKVQEEVLYRGLAKVENGIFSFSFILPKAIANQIDAGKISLYAFNQITDAHGANTKLLMGGAPPKGTPDSTPPQIKLYLNDETFVSGGITQSNPLLLAHFFDLNGINTASTPLGHEIVATLDNDQNQQFILNTYYTTEPNSYQTGRLSYALPHLTPGKHTISLKASDTHNNPAEASLEFVIAEKEKFTLQDTFNYPNPFSSHTTFSFGHNLAGNDLAIQIQIFTPSGSLVKTISEKRMNAKTRITDIDWDGKDDNNQLLARGLYIYRVLVHAEQRGISTERINKLIILN